MLVLRKTVTVIGVVAMGLVPLACSSSDDDGGSGTTTTTQCPFSGTTEPTETPGGASTVVATLQGVVPQASGCIDTIRFNFTPATPSATVEYASGPFTNTEGQPITIEGTPLVVTFTGATLGDPNDPQAYTGNNVIIPKALNHVLQATVQTNTAGDMAWVLDLDSKRPYTVSSSANPAYFVISIG
ncbi:MAG: hypothetical protein ACKO72_08355 [Actinomycetes bacterium]